MRKIVLTIFLLSIILTGCKFNENKVLGKIERQFNKSKGYENLLDIKINTEENKSQYRMKEKYKKDEKSTVEIISPKEDAKITLEYLEDKIIIKNPSIEQSIVLNDFKDMDNGFLVKDIFKDTKKLKFIEEKEIEGKKYYAFDYSLKDKNKYNYKRILLVDKKELKPFSLQILDREGKIQTIIYYENFKFLS